MSGKWEVEYTDELGEWWADLTEAEQESIDSSVRLLEEKGPKHSHMRELRVQHEGRQYRVLYAFDPRRCAILLLGGDKTGDYRWYVVHVPIADKLYDTHLETLRKEGQIND